jgi:tetratricopeptide (TPR) repeat protein
LWQTAKSDAEYEEQLTARQAALESMIHRLDQTLRQSPGNPDAHRQMASRLEQLFELRQQQAANSLPISQIRDAAVTSQFSSRGELRDWLVRAFGDDIRLLTKAYFHARRAVQLAPLQGTSYVSLADLCFLTGGRWSDVDAYLEQAQLVRPYDGSMLTHIGSQLAGRGQNTEAVECWVRAYRLRGPHRMAIIRSLAPHWPIAQFLAVFTPEWDSLPLLKREMGEATDEDLAALIDYCEEQVDRELSSSSPSTTPAVIWQQLAKMQQDTGRQEAAIESIRKSLDANPDNYMSRRTFGLVLNNLGRFDEAREQLEWCLGRNPNDGIAIAELKRPVKQRIAALSNADTLVTPTLAEPTSSVTSGDSFGAISELNRLPAVPDDE